MSGLSEKIYLWTNFKEIIIWKADFVKLLIRKYHIQETLGIVPYFWIPNKIILVYNSPRKLWI